VRCCHHYLKDKSIKNVLDYGFGTGANLIHLAKNNFAMSGCEISQHALDKTKSRLDSLHLSADLFCIEAEQELPWDDNYFDCVIAWQVLYYNNWVSWAKAVKELERVLKPGGIFLCCTAAPGDISHQM
jgi:ubiquinone/menaquinone biosynthesis C-methylase UbiE